MYPRLFYLHKEKRGEKGIKVWRKSKGEKRVLFIFLFIYLFLLLLWLLSFFRTYNTGTRFVFCLTILASRSAILNFEVDLGSQRMFSAKSCNVHWMQRKRRVWAAGLFFCSACILHICILCPARVESFVPLRETSCTAPWWQIQELSQLKPQLEATSFFVPAVASCNPFEESLK